MARGERMIISGCFLILTSVMAVFTGIHGVVQVISVLSPGWYSLLQSYDSYHSDGRRDSGDPLALWTSVSGLH